MKKFLLLFLTLTCAAVAQVKIDTGDIDWPNQSASQLFRRNVANNGFEFFTASPQLTLTGDATGTTTFTNLGNGSLALTLANSGVSANTYGSATQVPSFTVDAKGRITGVSLITATPAWGSVTGKPTAVDGSTTQSANTVFAGPASGSAAVPAFRALNQADTQAATAANRNALAARGGLLSTGATNTGASIALTGQTIGTDAFTLVLGLQVPSGTPTIRQGIVRLGTTGNSTPVSNDLSIYWEAGSNDLVIRYEGGSILGIANVVSRFAGKYVQIAIVKGSSGTIAAAYIDGAAQAVSGTNSGINTVNSAVLQLFQRAAGEVFAGTISFATLYNVALSAADVQEIYELGGGVPFRFQFGSQGDLVTGDSQTFTSGVGSWGVVGGAGDTISAVGGELQWTKGGTSIGIALSSSSWYVAAGKAFRFRFTHRLVSGSSNSISLDFTGSGAGWGAGGSFTPTSTPTVFDAVLVQPSGRSGLFEFYNGAGTGPVYGFDDIRVQRVGAVVHLDSASTGLGFQWRDSSTNGLHAERTSSGTSWTFARDTGRQTLTYTFAHSAISSTAATTTAFVLPPNTVLREVQLNRTAAFDGGTTLDIGISGTPTKFVSATSVAGTGFTQVASSSLVPESASATTTVFVKKNQATTTGSVTLNFIIEAVGSPTQ